MTTGYSGAVSLADIRAVMEYLDTLPGWLASLYRLYYQGGSSGVVVAGLVSPTSGGPIRWPTECSTLYVDRHWDIVQAALGGGRVSRDKDWWVDVGAVPGV